ncbi:MAG: sulfatase-like hydrolase/transferase [Phycisphaerae bacterium]
MAAPDRPDIVFFMVDQLSAKWLEGRCAGVIPTPNIDRLRETGVTFVNAFTSNPLCCPARATLATGLTTRGHGVLQNGYELDPAAMTFMRALQLSGWQTGAFGKVHLRSHYHGVHPDYRVYGFDVVRNTEDPRMGEWIDWVRAARAEHFEAALSCCWSTEIPELTAYGPEGEDLRARIREARKRMNVGDRPHGNYTLPFPEEVSQTAWITANAIEFIRSAEADRPLHAHISYVQPHSPFCPPAEFMDLVDAGQIPRPIDPEWAEDPRRPECFARSEGVHPTTPDDWRLYRKFYFADVAHLDRQLGLVIEALKQTARWDNTYLFFLSDHGELLLDHGFTGKGERHYDASIRIPLMIAGPHLGAALTCEAFVQLEDIAPTVLEMARLRGPTLPVGGVFQKTEPSALPGRSLVPLARGETPDGWRDSVYVESYNNLRTNSPAEWARTIRGRSWRYTYYPAGGGEQLFCLADDPDETTNLAYEEELAPVRAALRDCLLEAIVLQDHPHTPRSLYQLGVH